MAITRRLMLGAGAAAFAGAGEGGAQAATRSNGGGRAHRAALAAVSRYIEQHRTDWGLPGVTLCIVDRDGFAGFITSGYANLERRTPVGPEHLFQIGSISKVFTALTLYSMHAQGRLSPDARLRDALPGIPIRDADSVTLQHLINHTAGLPGNAPVLAEGGLWSAYAPGAHWHYSNTGYELLSRAIAAADGRLFDDALAARVLAPLGMSQSRATIRNEDRARHAQGYEPLYTDRLMLRPGPRAPAAWVNSDSGAGSVTATAGDMARFLRFLLGLTRGHGGGVLPDSMAAQFLADPADAPGWAPGARYGNGLARIQAGERAYLFHTGGMLSFSSAMHVDAEAGIAAFASANVAHTLGYRPRDITLYACEALAGADAPTPAPTRPSVTGPGAFAGAYAAATGERFDIRASGADQIILRRDGRDSALQSIRGPAFASADPRFERSGLVFERDGDTVVRAWAQDVEFVRDGRAPYSPAASPELQALAGLYENDDRWGGSVWVVARAGGLWLDNIEPMTALENGAWRVGAQPWSPERARFSGFVAGRPTQLSLSGAPFARRFS